MLTISKLIFLSAVLLGTLRAEDKTAETLHRCVETLKNTSRKYERLIPSPVVQWDRKLKLMAEGVPFIEQNAARILEAGGKQKEIHLMGNALMSCRYYQGQLEKRVNFLFLFLVSLCVSLFGFSCLAFSLAFAKH